jgi:hypothetical protein
MTKKISRVNLWQKGSERLDEVEEPYYRGISIHPAIVRSSTLGLPDVLGQALTAAHPD